MHRDRPRTRARARHTMIILLHGSVSVTDVPLALRSRLVKVQEPGKGCVNIRIV